MRHNSAITDPRRSRGTIFGNGAVPAKALKQTVNLLSRIIEVYINTLSKLLIRIRYVADDLHRHIRSI